MIEVRKLAETQRGEGGFGSTDAVKIDVPEMGSMAAVTSESSAQTVKPERQRIVF